MQIARIVASLAGICGAATCAMGLGRADEPVRMFGNAEAITEVHRLVGHKGEVLDATYLGDERLLTAGADGTLRLWDLTAGRQLQLVADLPQPITKLLPAFDRRQVFSFAANGEITVWQLPAPKRAWGPEQATGPPDSKAGDQVTAWASETEDDQAEWLLLEYADSVTPTAVRVYENDNPGAVVEVVAIDDDGREVTLWKAGDDAAPPTSKGLMIELPVRVPWTARRVKLIIDSPRMPGWNEIDAVGLVDGAGEVHWATAAAASSTYAEPAERGIRRGRRMALPPAVF